MKPSIIDTPLLWLAGADISRLREVSETYESECRRLTMMGASLLIPSGLGGLSMYALSGTILGVSDERALCAASVWGGIVFMIDRQFCIANKTSALSAALRVAQASVIALLVTHSIVQLVFKPEIDHEIARVHGTERSEINTVRSATLRALEDAANPDIRELSVLKSEQACALRVRQAESAGIEGEIAGPNGTMCGYSTGEKGCGPNCRASQLRVDDLSKAIQTVERRVEQDRNKIRERAESDLQALQQIADPANAGLLERADALGRVVESSAHARLTYWLVTFVLIILDLLPLAFKMSQAPGEYTAIHQTREERANHRETTNRTAHRISEEAKRKAMETAKDSVLLPLEVTKLKSHVRLQAAELSLAEPADFLQRFESLLMKSLRGSIRLKTKLFAMGCFGGVGTTGLATAFDDQVLVAAKTSLDKFFDRS